jgi:DNA-binding XRE family transcriptional regulator
MSVRESNPFRKFRTELGISQTEFGKKCNVSKHAILRLEQGAYDKPLPAVVEYVLANTDLNHATLLNDYEAFQKAVRAEEPLIFGNMALDLMSKPRTQHPLTYLRRKYDLNQTELAKKLCVSQTVINNFEGKWQTQHTVPRQLLDALSDNGYKHSALVALEEWYEAFRTTSLSQVGVKLVEAV